MIKKLLTLVSITIFTFGGVFNSATPIIACETLETCDQQLNDVSQRQSASQTALEAAKAEENRLALEIREYIRQIKLAEEEIKLLGENIKRLEEQIIALENEIARKDALVISRLAIQQEQNNANTLFNLLFSSDSLATLMQRWNSLETINGLDVDLVRSLNQDKVNLATAKQLAKDKQDQQEMMRVNLENLKAESEKLRAEMQAIVAAQEAELDTLAATQEDIERQKEILSRPPPIGGGGSGGGGSGGAIDGSWYFPVNENGIVTAHYLSPQYEIEYGRRHRGTDIAGNVGSGTPIGSMADGWVLAAGYYGALGNVVAVGHNVNGVNYVSLYAHLSSIYVSTGDYVYGGSAIGGMGRTGGNYGVHLHFELARRDYFTTSISVRDSTNFDPLDALPSWRTYWGETADAW